MHMKITKVTMKKGEMQQPVTTSLLAEVERMHSDRIFDGREQPQLMFGATFGRNGFDDVRRMTGLLMLTAASDSEQAGALYGGGLPQPPPPQAAHRGACGLCRRSRGSVG